MAEHAAVEPLRSNLHEGSVKWEYSWAPAAVVSGIFFGLPLAFSGYFVYENPLMSGMFGGLGVVLLLAGVSKWVSEGLHQRHGQYGYSTVALAIFIISEAVIFLGLFVAYWVIRLSAEAWPPAGTPHMEYALPLFMTAILLASSFTMHAGETGLKAGDRRAFIRWLVITIALGALFVGCSVYEYAHLIREGFLPDMSAFSSVFYSITGFHTSHLIIGIGIFIAVLLPAFAGKISPVFVKCAAVYWHFVDIVWLFVVSQVYFW